MKFFLTWIFFLLVLLSCTNSFAKLSDQEINTLKLQLFLDKNNFGPGYLDAKAGTFTMLAIKSYNLKHQRAETDFRYVQEAQSQIQDALITTVIPASADKFIDPKLSKDKKKQAKRKFMPYRSYAEYVAERFHTSVSFLSKINSYKVMKSLGPRSVITVPNVEPFLIENLSRGRMHKENVEIKNRYVIIDTSTNQLKIYEREFLVPAKQVMDAKNDTKDVESWDEVSAELNETTSVEQIKMVPANYSDEETFQRLKPADLVAAFPITPGKEQFIHRGYWKIKNSVELPIWRYDKSLLEKGVKGNEYLIIPGGPNNPVGIIWNGLTRSGIGIHGTNSPETIGRTKSAGCIRLSNWDASNFPKFVRPGAKVWLK